MTDITQYKIACEKLTRILEQKGIKDKRVLEAFRNTPRHLFVDDALKVKAYTDNALPIGLGQTISQPYIVALMTEALDLKENEKILEIGTGSGFQSAILAYFSKRVYTIERHAELGNRSRNLLRSMGYANIVFKIGDGTKGWPGNAPFDKIIVTAGAPALPRDLIKQLKTGGRIVIPSGGKDVQNLEIYEKFEDRIEKSIAGTISFVPLIGEKGWNK